MGFILYHKNKIKQIKYQHKVWFFLQIFVLEGIISCMLYVINLFMKKVFIWLKNNILRHKKKLIYGALALFIGQICFFNLWWLGVNNSVYAADTPTQNSKFQEKATDWLDLLSFLKKWCYILLYPMLVLAGVLVNNSFVYAEIFKFDVVLWQLWNVVRNLANYALWFLFVYKIFEFLATGQKSSDMSNLLKSTLIAWIWIQASWFLLAVLIDVSNVLTYSVGGLPIHVLWTQSDSWKNADFWNPYVYQTVISVDFNDPDTIHFYLSNTSTGNNQKWDKFIAECETFSFKENGEWEELIVAPKIVYYYDWTGYYKTEKDRCHVWDDVFYLGGFSDGILWQSAPNPTWKDSQNKYRDSLDKAIKKLTQKTKDQLVRGEIAAWQVLQIKNAHLTWDGIWYTYVGVTPWLDVDNKVAWEEWNMAKLHDILQWDDGYIWVFSALYSSLLNAGVQLTNSDSVYTSLLNTILSFCHTLALWIPLVAMVVVFFMRIGVIWMAIILSPVIILLKAFKLEEKVSKEVDILKYLSVGNLIGIIFSPAIICFAVSISTVLVRIISTVNAQDVMTNEQFILWWLVKINLDWMSVWLWKLICSVIGVAISWFLIWSAIKSSELWRSEIISWKNWLKGLAESTLWSVPLIPIPTKWGWVDFVWASTVFWWNWQQWIISKLSSNLKEKYEWENNKAVEALFKSEDPADVKAKQVSAYTSWLTDLATSQIGTNWMDQEIMIWEDEKNKIPITFTSLENADREKVIESINSLTNEDKRKAFGRVSTITVWTKVYKFDTSDNKYKVNDSSTPATSPSA